MFRSGGKWGRASDMASLSATFIDNESPELQDAFARETRRGALLAILLCALWSASTIVSALIDAAIAHGIPAFFHIPTEYIIEGCVAVLAPTPIYLIAARSKRPLAWCFVSMIADIAIFGQGEFFWIAKPAVFTGIPLFVEVRYGDVVRFLILLSIYALPLSRRFIAWGTAAVLAVWTVGIVHEFLDFKGATLFWGPFASDADTLHAMSRPEVLIPDFFVIQILLVIVFSAFLALSIQRGRRFVIDRVAAEADSAFLKRFFPPHIAAHIAESGIARLAPARRRVAVLFAQLERGETNLASLQANFAKLEAVVFAHGGTLDRFTGGPVMASFGASDADDNAAVEALACARALAHEAGPFAVSLHAGDAVCGDVGGTHSRVFSVVGDVVNVTRRLLDLADDGGAQILASGDFLDALPAARRDSLPFEDRGDVALRGRAHAVRLWSLHA